MKFIFSENEVRGERTFLYEYSENRFRIVKMKNCKKSGFEEISPRKTDYITPNEELDRISLSRAKRRLKEICLCNNFTHFATITVNSENADRFSLTQCQELLKKKTKNLRNNGNIDFAYVFITEKHQNGAFHFHGLVKGISDLYTNENGFLSSKKFDEVGFNSFLPIKTTDAYSYDRVCNYITKYISKDCIKNESGRIYFSSKGLKKPVKYEIGEINFNWNYENDYCCIKDFNFNSQLTNEELITFSQIQEKKEGIIKKMENIFNI